MKIERNVPTYALWPVKHGPLGYSYLWGCGHIDTMPHRCPKGPNRATLFAAPDVRTLRPAWPYAARFIDRHQLQGATADQALEAARKYVPGRQVA